jgi:intracellular septation protein
MAAFDMTVLVGAAAPCLGRRSLLNLAMALELAPVAVFFVANAAWGLMAATGALMAATLVCVVAGWRRRGHLPVLGLVTLVLVLSLGGLSLVFDDALFIQIKPTLGKLIFAAMLLVGMHLRPTMLERALGSMVILTDRGWRVLHWRWIALALFWAVANEVARRVLTPDQWVTFATVVSVVSIVGYILATRLTAPAHWAGPRDEDQPR